MAKNTQIIHSNHDGMLKNRKTQTKMINKNNMEVSRVPIINRNQIYVGKMYSFGHFYAES